MPGQQGLMPERGRVRRAGRRGATLVIAAGAVWALLALLGAAADQGALPGLSADVVSGLGLVPRVLVLFGLFGVHRVQQGRSGALGATGLGLTLVGLALDVVGRSLVFWVHRGTGDMSPGVALGSVLGGLGLVLVALGMALYGIAALVARALPLWGRVMPFPIAVLSVVVNLAPAEGVWLGALVGVLRGAAWASLGTAAYLVAPEPTPEEAARARESVWRPFLSLGTALSGLAAVAVWSLEWNPAVGILVVLLLYVHELGHVLAALLRGVRVEQAPFFLPGFGAFVQTGRTRSAWDQAWISLGGPAIGGAVALLVKLVGQVEEVPALAHAGDFALILNVLNLAPFSPLDGGRVAALTGWFGLGLTVLLGGALLLQGPGLFIGLLVVYAMVQAFRAAREPVDFGWSTRAGVAAVYFGLVVLEAGALVLSGRVPWLPSNRPAGLPSAGDVFEVVFWVYIAGAFLLPFAWREEQSARVRYGISAVLGWPQYLLGRPWMIPITVSLAAHTFGLPGLGWLEALIGRWSAAGNRSAAVAAAHAYDCLHREQDTDVRDRAGAWLDRMTPALERGGPEVLGLTYLLLAGMGHARRAAEWLARQNARRTTPLPLSPPAANAYAWYALHERREAHALPYARAAVAAEPEDLAYLDTLGRALLASGEADAAEAPLRRSLLRSE